MSSLPEEAGVLLGRLESHLADNPRRLSLRGETEDDLAFLEHLYASTRADEMSLVRWPDSEKQAFLKQQFNAQHAHYRRYYPGAVFLVLLHEGEPCGRLYFHLTASELRVMDIALLPEHRGRGLGRIVLDSVLGLADRAGIPVTLHVEPFNPARAWYERLGFETVELRGAYLFMRLDERCVRQAQEKLSS